MPNLQRALEIAITAHSGQKQKDGTPYAMHPIRVALSLENEVAQIVAVLHDVVEDTPVSLTDLKNEGFAPDIIEAIALLTKPDGADYQAYVEKIAANPLVRAVKIADLTDNMNVKRIAGPLTEKDLKRIQKYHQAWTTLTQTNRS
jgi:(p)ppGpp synthase/HD superfamily hydrolase